MLMLWVTFPQKLSPAFNDLTMSYEIGGYEFLMQNCMFTFAAPQYGRSLILRRPNRQNQHFWFVLFRKFSFVNVERRK